jgi:hypothetical protein
MLAPTERLCRACTKECEPSDFINFQTKKLIYSELTSIEVSVIDVCNNHILQNVWLLVGYRRGWIAKAFVPRMLQNFRRIQIIQRTLP